MIERPTQRAAYDVIARDYASINEKRPLNRFAGYPTLYEAVGDVKNRSVLDLACGTGTVSRAMLDRGARSVVGVDESKEMLKIAKSLNKGKYEMDYIHGRVGSLGHIGDFDIVTGGFLLHYAKNKGELLRMCADISENLSPGGIFVALNSNPHNPLAQVKSYPGEDDPTHSVEAVSPLPEGASIRVTSQVGDAAVRFTIYYWTQQTYERALLASGLTNIEWLHIKPTPEGVAEMGEAYWRKYLANPSMAVIRAQKPLGTMAQ